MRLYRNYFFIIITIFVVIILIVMIKLQTKEVIFFNKIPRDISDYNQNIRIFEHDTKAIQNIDNIQVVSMQSKRHVTASLAELGNRGYLPDMNENVLMVTRVPNAGAELLVLVLQHLQGHNNFKHIRLPQSNSQSLTNLQQELLVEELTSIIQQEAIPLTFDADVRFLNFSAFGRQAPTFISIVRHPLDLRVLDRFKSGNSAIIYTSSISHFCGQDVRCTKRNDKWALKKAKDNVIKWYPVVGILDHMRETLNALQKAFPYFFRGAIDIYESICLKRTNTSVILQQLSNRRIKSILADEIEFYYWLKSRLLN